MLIEIRCAGPVSQLGATEPGKGSGIQNGAAEVLVRDAAEVVALGSLIRRFPRMDLMAEPEFGRRMTLRGLTDLQITLGT